MRLTDGERLEELDLAPYRIAKDSVAVGVRTQRPFEADTGTGTEQLLSLFLMQGQQLRLIGSTMLAHFSSFSTMNDDWVREYFKEGCDKPASITVRKSSSHGFFDLKKSQEGRSVILKWDGTTYVAEGEDPVTDVKPPVRGFGQ